MHFDIVRGCTTLGTVSKLLAGNRLFLENITKQEKLPQMTKINVQIAKFDVINREMSREEVKDLLCFEQYYDTKAEKRFRDKEL